MIDLHQAQKDVWQNKLEKGFNTTDIYKEFCLTHEELSEACRAYYKKQDVGEELADVAIYLLALSEMLKIDLESEILRKMKRNKDRVYQRIDGVMTRVKDA